MKIFWILILITGILSMIAYTCPTEIVNKQTGQLEYKANRYLILLNYIILIIVSGLRDGIGDTGAYRGLFGIIPPNIIEYLNSNLISEDRGFYFIVAIIKQFISSNSQVILFVLAAITLILICITMYRNTDNIGMATFLFITMGYYAVSMNGVRQFLAAAIIFSILPLHGQKKFIPYCIIILLVSTIHASAIIFLPLYFIVNYKGWSKLSYFFCIGGIVFYLIYDFVGPALVGLIGNTQYSEYSDVLLSTGQGANIIRSLVAFVPVMLSYIKKDMINQELKYGNIIINFNILNFIFTLLANKYWIFARFCIYFNLYSILLLCYCVENIFERKSSQLVKIMCVVCYLIYFWYDSLCVGLNYTSQYINLSIF